MDSPSGDIVSNTIINPITEFSDSDDSNNKLGQNISETIDNDSEKIKLPSKRNTWHSNPFKYVPNYYPSGIETNFLQVELLYLFKYLFVNS